MSDYDYHKDHTEPTQCAVFVFGSNLAARHVGGAARLAEMKYGASSGVAEGMSGSSYAIPTKDVNIETLPLDVIRLAVKRFIEEAWSASTTTFFVTRIGCVLAGYNDAEIAPMFFEAPTNCNFPIEWKEYLEIVQ